MKSNVVAHMCDPTSLMTREALETKGPPRCLCLWKGRSEHHPPRFPSTYVLWQAYIAFTDDHAQTRNTPTDIRYVVDDIHQALLLFLYLVVSVAEYFHTSSLKMMATQ